jgi:DDE superfamily endonuclease
MRYSVTELELLLKTLKSSILRAPTIDSKILLPFIPLLPKSSDIYRAGSTFPNPLLSKIELSLLSPSPHSQSPFFTVIAKRLVPLLPNPKSWRRYQKHSIQKEHATMSLRNYFRIVGLAATISQLVHQHMEDADAEEEDELLCVLSAQLVGSRQRSPKKQYDRMNWDEKISSFSDEDFAQRYRMSKSSFNKLVDLLSPYLAVDEKMSRVSTGGVETVIRPEHCVHCLLSQWRNVPLLLWHCPYVREFLLPHFVEIDRCCELLSCFEMDLPFPPQSNPTRIEQLKETFRNIATSPAFQNCVGAIDGWLCVIQTPSKSEESNIRSFYSGHYRTMGLNVQAMVDRNGQLTYAAINSPRGTNDIIAYQKSRLCDEFVGRLSSGDCIVGDNAYPLGTHLLVPFSRPEIRTGRRRYKEIYNFYLSQLRIGVEMAFGMLVNKFGFSEPH